jgi:hypothetical protein
MGWCATSTRVTRCRHTCATGSNDTDTKPHFDAAAGTDLQPNPAASVAADPTLSLIAPERP